MEDRHGSHACIDHMSPPCIKLTPEQKLRISSRLYLTARKVMSAGLRRRHRDWSEERLTQELNRRFFLLHD